MKQKDITVIVGAVVLSVIVSFVVSSKFLVTPAKRQQQVEVVPVISEQFNVPSSKYFNNKSINPTQLITIGNNTNNAPFNQASGQ